jgi:hypothetical protein
MQHTTQELEAAYWRGYQQGYAAGFKEGALSPAEREARALRMRSMLPMRILDGIEPAMQHPCPLGVVCQTTKELPSSSSTE